MEVGTKIYYDKTTGEPIQIVEGYAYDGAYNHTTEEDFERFTALAERVPESVGLIQLEYGQYREEFFLAGNNVKVDTETKKLEFIYPNPDDPEETPVYKPPLSEEIELLKRENTLLKAQNQANTDRADFQEEVITEIILAMYQ